MDGACAQACVDADPSPDCNNCIQQNAVSDINRLSCQSLWDPYICCIEDECGTMATAACAMGAQMGACASLFGTWDTCAGAVDLSMSSFAADCF